jgi:hypothetical protein
LLTQASNNNTLKTVIQKEVGMPKKGFSSPFVLWTSLLAILVVCFKAKAECYPDIPKSQPAAQRSPTIGEAQKTPQQQIDDLKLTVRELRAEPADCKRQISGLRTELKFANKKINELDERTKNISPKPRFQPVTLPPFQITTLPPFQLRDDK